nr:MAG TPA: hypothetical protein [Caudoviricetes sp.]
MKWCNCLLLIKKNMNNEENCAFILFSNKSTTKF